MEGRVRTEECRTKLICVDSYEHGVMTGRLYDANYEDEGTNFHSLVQLLLEMEQRLNAMNYPQSFTEIRSFVPLPKIRFEGASDGKRSQGRLATFAIKILFRQHTSWQGTITWLDNQSEQTFRSVLELILLLDSALGGGQEKLYKD